MLVYSYKAFKILTNINNWYVHIGGWGAILKLSAVRPVRDDLNKVYSFPPRNSQFVTEKLCVSYRKTIKYVAREM